MTRIDDLTELVRTVALGYERCGHEQALVYACEDVVEQHLGSREMAATDVRAWMETVCDREDLDPPMLVLARASSTNRASADPDGNVVCIRGSVTTVSTVIHELAHVSTGGHSHRVLFRDELVRLSRAHISVDHAAMLHALFRAVGLDVAPWPASASRR